MNEISIKFAPGRALNRKQAPGARKPRKPMLWKRAALLLEEIAAWCERKHQDRITRITRENLKRIQGRKGREWIDLSGKPF